MKIWCSVCKKDKEDSNFNKNKTTKSGFSTDCKQCNKEYLQRRRKDPRYSLFNNAKYRAKKLNLDFTITIDDIIIPEFCPVFNKKLEIGHNKTFPNTPSLDRIYPNIGYTKENIWVISHRANKIKNDASFEELKLLSSALQMKIEETK